MIGTDTYSVLVATTLHTKLTSFVMLKFFKLPLNHLGLNKIKVFCSEIVLCLPALQC